MKQFYFPILLMGLLASSVGLAQTNISVINATAEQVMQGQFNPADYQAANVINDHELILCELNSRVSPDSLHSYLETLNTFQNRNTHSDTVSQIMGIGAARRWIHHKFEQFSAREDDRLIPGYLEFDWIGGSCGDDTDLRNVLAVLPGSDTSNHSLIFIEAHMDSRCEDRCDVNCDAPGMEDNGSGTALVIELARVMSRYSFKHTLVFMTTTGEEQGLMGAHAMAQYCQDNNIPIKGVQNNDIVGGILCGATSSPPSCVNTVEVDSLRVRLFSSASGPSRVFARTIKLFYLEKLVTNVAVSMSVDIINQEDRTGRGGDHIPFRQRGFRAMRFTAAHEHGHGAPDSTYTDRQHTTTDLLGIDTDNDQVLDSFYIDFNYLARNTVINGVTTTLLALGPAPPTFSLTNNTNGVTVDIDHIPGMPEYRIGVADANNTDFVGLYLTSDTTFNIPGITTGNLYRISVASVDADHITSPFSNEQLIVAQGTTAPGMQDTYPYGVDCNALSVAEVEEVLPNLELMPCRPNPWLDQTIIPIKVNRSGSFQNVFLNISDPMGRPVVRMPLQLQSGLNEIVFQPKPGMLGIYFYTLEVDDTLWDTKKMVVLGR